jgi:hypothetical protein
MYALQLERYSRKRGAYMQAICSVEGCERGAKLKGMCTAHYRRWRKGKRGAELTAPLQYHDREPAAHCLVEGCERRPTSKGMCHAHYKRWLRGTLNEKLTKPVETDDHGADVCSIPGCTQKVECKGLCNAHYIRSRKGTSMLRPLTVRGAKEAKCRVPDCTSIVGKKGSFGFCSKHYRRLMRKLVWDEIIKMKGGKCERCGGEFPYTVYDLHHRDPSQKEFTISHSFGKFSRETILREAEKCDLLCVNCHRIVHFGDGSEFSGFGSNSDGSIADRYRHLSIIEI